MEAENLKEIEYFVDKLMAEFYRRTREFLESLSFQELMVTNPYMLGITGTMLAAQIVQRFVDMAIAKRQEELVERFFADLALFVANQTFGGYKSSAHGVNFEFLDGGVHYLVSMRSGPEWGSSSQQAELAQDLKEAVSHTKESSPTTKVRPVLGICYGKAKTSKVNGYLRVEGQNFWYLISKHRGLYTEIVELMESKARKHDGAFLQERGRALNRFTKLFLDEFCTNSGAINWTKLVEFNSQNFDLENFFN